MRQPAEGPQFTLPVLLLRAVISTPVAPAGASNDVFPVGVVFAQLQGARQPRCPRQSRSTEDVLSKLQCSLNATARTHRLPCSGQDFYFRAFAGWVAPVPASDMTRWFHRHLPSPAIHRLNWQPYGLQWSLDILSPLKSHFSLPFPGTLSHTLSELTEFESNVRSRRISAMVAGF